MGVFDELHEAGNTIILVTHENEIAGHALRVIRLRDGLIETDRRQYVEPQPPAVPATPAAADNETEAEV
jgi:putative ABC transport system ATP-binding protein